MRLRWNLQSVFIFTTLIAIALGWRYNERNAILRGTQYVEANGGQVAYRWQKPLVKPFTVMLMPSRIREIKYSVMVDGKIETRTRTEGYTVYAPTAIDHIALTATTRPANRAGYFSGFFSGNHDDIAVEVVILPPNVVDDAMTSALRDLKGLKTVMCYADRKSILQDAQWSEFQKSADKIASKLKPELPHVQIIPGMGFVQPL